MRSILRVQTARVAKTGMNSRGSWALYVVKLSDGSEITTFNFPLYVRALKAARLGYEVDRVTLEPVYQQQGA